MTDEKLKSGISDADLVALRVMAEQGPQVVLDGIEFLVGYLIALGGDTELRDGDPRAGDILGKCQGCDRPVIWVAITKKDGKPGRLPLDARAPVYLVDTVHGYPGARIQEATRAPGAYVSHFATCKKPDHFSQASRKKTDA